MTKSFFLVTLLFVCSLFNLKAGETTRYENTTFNVIRERYFAVNNSFVYRYEDEIRIKLHGASVEDSLLVQSIVEEWNGLMETTKVIFGDNEPNFEIEFLQGNGSINTSFRQTSPFTFIEHTKIRIYLKESSLSQKLHVLQYYMYRGLLRPDTNKRVRTRYQGIFDSEEPNNVIHEIDKDIVRKVYANNFYEQFKANTIKNHGWVYYMILRYKYLCIYLVILFGIIVTLLTLLYTISRSEVFVKGRSFLHYIRNGAIVLIGISIVYTLISFLHNPLSASRNLISYFISSFIQNMFVGSLVVILLFFTERLAYRKSVSYIKKQFLTFFITLICIFSTALVIQLVLMKNKYAIEIPVSLTQLIKLKAYVYTLFLATIIASFRVFFNYLNYRTQSMVNKKDVELSKMTALKNQAELQALQSRINPHFLYNALNSIAGLAESSPAKVQKMSLSLSELFRYSVNKENTTYVSVQEELKMVEKYLEVEKVRFGDKLLYSIEVNDTLNLVQIPKFMIQPLVENAIKHAASKMTSTCKVTILVQLVSGDFVVKVSDNGPVFPKELVNGYGLQNLHDKLQILYGESATINWENGDDKHIQITLKNQL